jgi:GNAT superfamily N-acetyltransferase
LPRVERFDAPRAAARDLHGAPPVLDVRQEGGVMSGMNGFTVRRAGSGDRAHVLSAVARLFPGIDVARRYEWLYEHNPAGRALTWIATCEHSGRIAGITSLFPWRMVAGARGVMGALGGDGYVYPEFRRRGIATAMHAASREALKDLGFEVMFGEPRPANATPLARHDARNVIEIVRHVRAVGGAALGLPPLLHGLARRVLRPSRRGFALETAHERDRRIDEIWERTCPELDVATVRDTAFYDWWFRRSPDRLEACVVAQGGRPIAACALERTGRRVCVLDILAPRNTWPATLEAILACTDDCDIVELRLARREARGRRVWTRGFIARDSKPVNVMLPEGSARAAIYFDATRWFFTSV